ncbi:MAG: hypothetical protein ACM31C_17240 [Acidobacteriota bacterium]
MARIAWLVVVVACAHPHSGPPAPARGVVTTVGPGGIPDVRCAAAPAVGPSRGFRHLRERVVAALGAPLHRGHDLIAVAGAEQIVEGAIAYSALDKALEDEDVDLYACDTTGWRWLAQARTDADGRFAIALAPRERVPIGLRDLYVSVLGDRTGVRFVAYVAPAGTPLVISDVDGTLTSSENAWPKSLVDDDGVAPQPGAPEALRALGYQIVYVTSRGERFTDATRSWLASHGFPRGPVRLARSLFALPGAASVAYKRATLHALDGFVLVAGIGNRGSDVAAYAAAGIPPDRIFIKLPEFASELVPGSAIGFASYAKLPLPRRPHPCDTCFTPPFAPGAANPGGHE